MKRLLLSLLVTLSFPTTVNAWEDGGGWKYGGNYRDSWEAEMACKNWAIEGGT